MDTENLTRADYDTRRGIRRMLSSGLEGLNALRDARQEAYYQRKERLEEWMILGHWWTDTCGNFGKIIEGALENGPTVLEREDAIKVSERLSWTSNSSIPPHLATCAQCGKGFTVENAHRVQELNKHTHELLDRFIGSTMNEANDILRHENPNEIRFIIAVKNDAWINRNKHPRAKELDNDWVINKDGYRELAGDLPKGWDDEARAILCPRDEKIIPATTGSLACFTWQHIDCYTKRRAENARSSFAEIFKLAGFETIRLDAIPNEYCNKPDCCPPWFFVETNIGRFKIGHRKNVDNLDWEGINVDGEKLFANENVTKGSRFIHSWNDDKLVEYLTRIRLAVTA